MLLSDNKSNKKEANIIFFKIINIFVAQYT